MDKITIYGAMQYFFFKKMNISKTLADMQETLGKHVSSKIMMCRWVDGIKGGDMSLEDEERPSLPKRVPIAKMVEEIHDIVLGDRR